MRRLLLLSVVLLAFPAAARPAANDTATSLTLSGPGATTYGHQVDFVGRISPSTSGAHVRLLRGSTFVADGYTNPDGSYRIQVDIARPGPFHAEAAGVASPDVTVRIIPQLAVAIVGARVAGSPLQLRATLTPDYAGAVRVRVTRSGGRTFAQLFGPSATVALGTSSAETFQIVVQTLAKPGFASVTKTVPVSLRPPTLTVGDKSPLVAEFLRQLSALGYEIPAIQQTFDYDVQESVFAFEKVQGLDRTGVVDAAFWSKLADPIVPKPRDASGDHIEVDKARQVLFIVRGGAVKLISPVSTAGIPGYFTPVGTFAIFRKVDGYDPSPLGILYKPMYFTGGYAIHGNPSVPPYPASHGCIRVPNFVITRLFTSEPYGETVIVY
jgi:hypothetical protein